MPRDIPYWIDDPAIDRATHRLNLTSAPGRPGRFTATCSCGVWSLDKQWDDDAHAEAFDGHMREVQEAARTVRDAGARTAAGKRAGYQRVVATSVQVLEVDEPAQRVRIRVAGWPTIRKTWVAMQTFLDATDLTPQQLDAQEWFTADVHDDHDYGMRLTNIAIAPPLPPGVMEL